MSRSPTPEQAAEIELVQLRFYLHKFLGRDIHRNPKAATDRAVLTANELLGNPYHLDRPWISKA